MIGGAGSPQGRAVKSPTPSLDQGHREPEGGWVAVLLPLDSLSLACFQPRKRQGYFPQPRCQGLGVRGTAGVAWRGIPNMTSGYKSEGTTQFPAGSGHCMLCLLRVNKPMPVA